MYFSFNISCTTLGGANPLTSLLNLNSLNTQQPPAAPVATQPEEYSSSYRIPKKPLPAKHFGIPLLRVSEINKSSEPNPVHLAQTPDAKRAWIAAEEHKQRSSAMDAPPPPSFAKLIKLPGVQSSKTPVEYDHHAHTHYVPGMYINV